MRYPEFFNNIETIKLQDSLSEFLGTFEDGIVEFSYLEIVKSAGHSCPTVAGAYIMALVGLKALYKDQLPQRGEIEVLFKEKMEDGVAGVIGNVFTQITGATQKSGFKGIAGNFVRHDLMKFEQSIRSSVQLKRLDTNQTVDIVYDPSSIKPDPQQGVLMQKIIQNQAVEDEKQDFGRLWQQRVENIFANIDKVAEIV